MDTLPAFLPHAAFVRRQTARAIGATPRALTRRIVGQGGILVEPGQPPALVGDLQWEDSRTVFWFAAFGDQPRDAHRLSFDDAECTDHRVVFRSDGDIVAELAEVDHARVDDPDDYRTAWSLWQQIIPMRAAFIHRCYERMANEDAARGASDDGQ